MNTLAAFKRSFAAGFGCELDVRDAGRFLVVSHDPPAPTALGFDVVLDVYQSAGQPGALAINVKADGLGGAIAEACKERGVTSFFCFDQSVPDLFAYVAAGVPSFTRHSDIEPAPALYDRAAGVWLDAFANDDWFGEETVAGHVAQGKQVCLVSPELHGRDPYPAWAAWTAWSACRGGEVMVCTDHPDALAKLVA